MRVGKLTPPRLGLTPDVRKLKCWRIYYLCDQSVSPEWEKQPVVNRGGGGGSVTMTSGTGTTRNAKKKPLNFNRSEGKNTRCNRFRKVSARCTRALLLVLFEADTHGECHCCVVCHYRIRSPGALQSEEESANLWLPHVTTCTSVA